MDSPLPVSPQQPMPQPAVTPPPQSPPLTPVSAPPQPQEEFAGFGARFLATLVDWVIVGAIYFVLMIPVLVAGAGAAAKRTQPTAAMLILQLLLQGIAWILTVGYYVYFTAKGQTLGKKALKIKVCRMENGQAPGYLKAFLREIVGKMVSAFVFGLGYLWLLWDSRKQAWHDKIAGTIVVKA